MNSLNTEWKLAKEGLKLMINNSEKESEELFLEYPNSLVMLSGYSFTVFMDAIMSLEEDKIQKAVAILRDVEKRCEGNGWFSSVRSRVFGSASTAELTLEEDLERQIILADSQVCLAILIFLQQELSGYIRASWILRKSWKVYDAAHTEILNLYQKEISPFNLPDPNIVTSEREETKVEPSDNKANIALEQEMWGQVSALNVTNGYSSSSFTSPSIPNSNSAFFVNSENGPKNLVMKKSFSMHSALARSPFRSLNFKLGSFNHSLSFHNFAPSFTHFFSSGNHVGMNKKSIIRLMNAVAFGFGLFQLGVSLLPQSLVRIISILGVSGDRNTGLAYLMYARQGIDMRAPLATLALLWFHSIVRPFYAIDGQNVQAGVNIAQNLLGESHEEFGQSALFLFFKGRVDRLNSDLVNAIQSFRKCIDNTPQRELKLLAEHEVGWCFLIGLDYASAKNSFFYLSTRSRWSQTFYAYLTCVCTGAADGLSSFANFTTQIKAMTPPSKINVLDEFIMRRLAFLPSSEEKFEKTTKKFWRLFLYELLYLWNALASCSSEHVKYIIQDCDMDIPDSNNEPMVGLSKLIQGSSFLLQNQTEKAVICFKKCIEARKQFATSHNDTHILAFTLYELGAILIRSAETNEEGRHYLGQALSLKDYDFDQRLSVRITSLLNK